MTATKKPAAKRDVFADLVIIEAVEPIRHDGIDVAPGQLVDVTPEAAAALIASGAAKSVEER